MNKQGEHQEGHESKRSRLVGALDVPADTVGHVCLSVDVCGEMNATMLPDITAMTAECQDRSGDQLPVESKLVAKQDRVRDEDKRDPGSLEGRERSAQRTGLGERAPHVRALLKMPRACEVVVESVW